jgi:hypothetical protein
LSVQLYAIATFRPSRQPESAKWVRRLGRCDCDRRKPIPVTRGREQARLIRRDYASIKTQFQRNLFLRRMTRYGTGQAAMSALPLKAGIDRHDGDVRLVPEAGSCTAARSALFDHCGSCPSRSSSCVCYANGFPSSSMREATFCINPRTTQKRCLACSEVYVFSTCIVVLRQASLTAVSDA